MRLNIDRVAIHPRPWREGSVSDSRAPGTILDASTRLLIATGDAALEILELQPAGKRSMPAAEFLRGNRVTVSDRFGVSDASIARRG